MKTWSSLRAVGPTAGSWARLEINGLAVVIECHGVLVSLRQTPPLWGEIKVGSLWARFLYPSLIATNILTPIIANSELTAQEISLRTAGYSKNGTINMAIRDAYFSPLACFCRNCFIVDNQPPIY